MASNLVFRCEESHKRLPPLCVAPSCEIKPHVRVNGVPLCTKHGQRYRIHGAFDLPIKAEVPWHTCSQDGCENPSRTRKGSLCEVHYYRRYRTGSFDGPNYKRRYVASHGYIVLRGMSKHPLTGSNGHLYEHRKVLYEAIGPGSHSCHWCKKPIEWQGKGKSALVADHLDSNKQNNDSSNLVPSCHRCNGRRGLFMTWIMDHRDDPFLMEIFKEAMTGQEGSGLPIGILGTDYPGATWGPGEIKPIDPKHLR